MLPSRTELRATAAITAALRAAAHALLALLTLPAYAYHPLATEDTETIGAGRHQFELSLDRARGVERSRSDQVNLILSYGLAEKLDLQFGATTARAASRAHVAQATRARISSGRCSPPVVSRSALVSL